MFTRSLTSKIFLITAGFLLIWLAVGGKDKVFSQDPLEIENRPHDSLQRDSWGNALTTMFNYQGQLLDSAGNPINNAAMPMKFRFYSESGLCWEEDRTGANAVAVENGRFQVYLGQITPIPTSCFQDGDVELELEVNGEVLMPRELLTSVAHAIEASTLPHNATTGGFLNIGSGPSPEGGQINLLEGDTGNGWSIDNRFGTFRLHHDNLTYFSVDPDGNIVIEGNLNLNGELFVAGLNTPFSILTERPWVFEQRGSGSGTTTVLRSTSDSKNFRFFSQDDTAILSIDAVNGAGSVTVHNQLHVGGDTDIAGDLIVLGDCNLAASKEQPAGWNSDEQECSAGSITSGAYIESNLMTPSERSSPTNPRFELGDLLCWNGEEDRLETCNVESDPLVMAVANSDGKPIVLGAEFVKVSGPVEEGDYLVASNIPGYAVATKTPVFGVVIAQALESFDGEQGVIMAMIRKM